MLPQKNLQPLTGLANHLVYANLLTHEIALNAHAQAIQLHLPLTSYLVTNNIMTSTELVQACAKIFDLPIIDLTTNLPLYDVTELELIRRYHVIPLQKQNGQLQLGMTDPTDQAAMDAMIFHSGLRISIVLVAEDQLNKFIETRCHSMLTQNYLTLKELSKELQTPVIQEIPTHYDEPLIKFVDEIIQPALQKSASDIHIEPYETYCRIRYRQDGILYQITEIMLPLALRLITRLKVMAKLDVAERRLPQDGRFQLEHRKPVIDIRINTCPTLFGEKIVLRILNANKSTLAINNLGFTTVQQTIFLKKIIAPQGLILVTGPTGSGKTVTLYSALNYLNNATKNISTIEDPVEIQLGGINQININPKIGLSFSTILRTLLRQDPDVIMIGEIRDQETAEIALHAAQTGHLVLSTLHTNNAIETLARLQSMLTTSQHLIHSITLIIAQRLVRKLCNFCKLKTLHENLGIIYQPQTCQHCLEGYQGRTGIYEFLPMTNQLIELIENGKNQQLILEHLERDGFMSLRKAAMQLVLQGITSLAEINRVIHE